MISIVFQKKKILKIYVNRFRTILVLIDYVPWKFYQHIMIFAKVDYIISYHIKTLFQHHTLKQQMKHNHNIEDMF